MTGGRRSWVCRVVMRQSGAVFSALTVSVLLLSLLPSVSCQQSLCPANWVSHSDACYRFTRSPPKSRQLARQMCQDLSADLLSITSEQEHSFIVGWLNRNDLRQRKWYTSGQMQSGSVWFNEADGSTISAGVFLPNQEAIVDREAAAYEYSDRYKKWGLRKVSGDDQLPFVCEVSGRELRARAESAGQQWQQQQLRDHWYGQQLVESQHRLQLVPRGPRITEQPEDTVFDPATRSTLNHVAISCMADGFPYVEYAWYKSAYLEDPDLYTLLDPLLPANSRLTVSGGTLMISDPQQDVDRGVYQCRASNQFGTVVSRSVQLSFALIGEFNQHRSAELGQVSRGKVISCDAPHTFPDALYQWSRDTFNNFVERDRRVFVSRNGNLYFSTLERGDMGYYTCSVRTSVTKEGRNGPLFRLDVQQTSSPEGLRFAQNFPAIFPSSPQEGDTVRLECVAYGYPVPSYAWSRVDGGGSGAEGGGALPAAARVLDHGRVLELARVGVADQGVYRCTASTERRSLTADVTLQIKAKPRFSIPLDDRHVDENSEVTWVCEAFGIPEVTYSWLRNGKTMRAEDFVRDPRVQIRDSRLTIANVTVSDQAMYQCRALNHLAASYSSAQLRVLQLPPSFAKRPLQSLLYAGVGGSVSVACSPEAAPLAQIQWRRDNAIIGESGRVRVLPSGALLVEPVAPEDAAVYTCVATNVLGTASSSTTLQVLAAPVLQQQPPASVAVVEDTRQQLLCAAAADSRLDLAYLWTHNHLPLRFQQPQTRFRRFDESGGIEIANVTAGDAGLYTCIARTAVGQVNASTVLRVLTAPDAPGGVQVSPVNATSVLLRWRDFGDHGRPIERYRIEARTNWNQQWFLLADDIRVPQLPGERWSSERSHLLSSALAPNSRYEFRVAAANQLGYSAPSPPSPSIRTVPAPPSVAPEVLPGGGGMSGDLHIRWKKLAVRDRNADGVYYKVFWKRVGIRPESSFTFRDLRRLGDVDHFITAVGDRYFYTLYKVKVQAFNALGAGPVSPETDVYSAEGMPNTVPTNVNVWPFNSTALNVSWTGIEPGRDTLRGNLVGYRVKYWPFTGSEATDSLIKLSAGANTSALVVGLKPYTQYFAKVMVYNKAGSGQESESGDGITYKMAPRSPPTGVNVQAIDPSTVEVTWRMSSINVNEESLSGFKIRVWKPDQDMSEARDTLVPLGVGLRWRVQHLQPGQDYILRVLAYSRGGDGAMSSPPFNFKLGDEELRSVACVPHVWHILMLSPLVMALAWLHAVEAL